MISARCECGAAYTLPESDVGKQSLLCRNCGCELRFVSAEVLPDGAGAGDFDARLIVAAGPARVGEQFFLGGCCEIEVGKLPERHVALAGEKVSRLHCKLLRLDFGPSRWNLEDNHSTNGLLVNGRRVTGHELAEGDVIQVGEYALRYTTAAPAPIAAVAAPVPVLPLDAPVCPSCERGLHPGARLCIDCGVYVPSGRPVVTSKGLDDERVAEVARASIYLPSFITFLGILPVASEGFGTRKPYAIWTIAAVTVACSFMFFPVACARKELPSPQALNLMHWTGDRELRRLEVEEQIAELEEKERELDQIANQFNLRSDNYDYQRAKEKFAEAKRRLRWRLPDDRVGFQPHQLLTSAFLHAGLLHLAGNMLFLLVFGLRVNEVLGNVKTAIVYPILAVGSSAIHMWASRSHPLTASLGASGAIAGLAGMYLVFFPVQRVRMIAYLNLWLLTAFQCLSVLFWMRGFWLLLMLFVWSDIIPVVFKRQDQVAHWAHLGGFGCGILIAVGLLVVRQVQPRGDILSVALGRYAWPLVGRPNRQAKPTGTAAAAV